MILIIEFSDLLLIIKFNIIIVIPVNAKYVPKDNPFALAILGLW